MPTECATAEPFWLYLFLRLPLPWFCDVFVVFAAACHYATAAPVAKARPAAAPLPLPL